jgi:hypothetical protein
VVVVADSLPVHKLSGERLLPTLLGTARRGDTLLSFATVQTRRDTVERYFCIFWNGTEAWIHQGNGFFARTEYDVVASVFDTKFFVPPELDGQAWQRALEYARTRSVRPLLIASEALIEHSPRGKITSERDIAFVIKRTPVQGGFWYTVKADGSYTNLHARKCALFIQTGKDERSFQGIERLPAAYKTHMSKE